MCMLLLVPYFKITGHCCDLIVILFIRLEDKHCAHCPEYFGAGS